MIKIVRYATNEELKQSCQQLNLEFGMTKHSFSVKTYQGGTFLEVVGGISLSKKRKLLALFKKLGITGDVYNEIPTCIVCSSQRSECECDSFSKNLNIRITIPQYKSGAFTQKILKTIILFIEDKLVVPENIPEEIVKEISSGTRGGTY